MPGAVTLIDFFEVPAEADEAFIEGWERAREGFGSAALHRALRPDADFRFVDVARIEAPDRWHEAVADPGLPGRPGLYEAIHEDGAPDAAGGVVLINAFEVGAGDDERFVAGWHRTRDVLAARRGYLGTRLHRCVARAGFRFVNVARWSSPLMFSRATGEPDFLRAAAEVPFASHAALYLVVR